MNVNRDQINKYNKSLQPITERLDMIHAREVDISKLHTEKGVYMYICLHILNLLIVSLYSERWPVCGLGFWHVWLGNNTIMGDFPMWLIWWWGFLVQLHQLWKMNVGLFGNNHYCCLIVTKIGMHQQISVKLAKIKSTKIHSVVLMFSHADTQAWWSQQVHFCNFSRECT